MAHSGFRSVGLVVLLGFTTTVACCQTDLELARSLQPAFERCSSRLMVRVITDTTRAALDHLTHDRNPLFHYPSPADLQPPPDTPALADLHFEGALVAAAVRDRIEQTPLAEAETARPLAWQPLSKLLVEWDYDAAEGLLQVARQVSGEKWGNAGVVRPLQQLAALYLHGDELWAKVEFRPELEWIAADDEDADGYRELYAPVAPDAYGESLLEYLRGDYLSEPLDLAELETYFFELASDWYQALQTVALKPEESHPWPGEETEPEFAALLDGGRFASPLAVVRGKPYGEVIYNVFVLEAAPEGGAAREAPQEAADVTAPTEAAPDGGGTPETIGDELRLWGGSWEAWTGLLSEFRADIAGRLEARPAEIKGLIGLEDWLFFRGDVEYLLSGDLRQQPDNRDPFPAIVDFDSQLKARGIDMLLVVIPTKAEVYPEKLSDGAPTGARPYVAPYCRKLLSELAEAGVATVDLLPTFIACRDSGAEPLYMPQDTHWTNTGLRLAARLIAEAVRERPVADKLPLDSGKYGARTVACTRLGDICAMLTDQEKGDYRPARLTAQQVTAPDGKPYVDDPTSPLVVLGDSFTGVFHLEDCRHAGLSAHLARDLGMPVDLIMAQGSGPRIRGQFARRGPEAIGAKRLVVWTVVARDLYNYWAPWDLIKVP
jgi:alginate O-acetyltransferase complex protein AlgJ